jgi:hypothetical protein
MKGKRHTTEQKIRILREADGAARSSCINPSQRLTLHLAQFSGPAQTRSRYDSNQEGNWFLGPKPYISTDRDSKLLRAVVVTAANLSDMAKTVELLHD